MCYDMIFNNARFKFNYEYLFNRIVSLLLIQEPNRIMLLQIIVCRFLMNLM